MTGKYKIEQTVDIESGRLCIVLTDKLIYSTQDTIK